MTFFDASSIFSTMPKERNKEFAAMREAIAENKARAQAMRALLDDIEHKLSRYHTDDLNLAPAETSQAREATAEKPSRKAL